MDGQPWLVNAIARECIEKQLQNDYTNPVTAEMVEQAVHTIILRRDVHIDSLLERLQEERVRKVMEPVILGYAEDIDYLSDDFMYCMDLGLIRIEKGQIVPGNRTFLQAEAKGSPVCQPPILQTAPKGSDTLSATPVAVSRWYSYPRKR